MKPTSSTPVMISRYLRPHRDPRDAPGVLRAGARLCASHSRCGRWTTRCGPPVTARLKPSAELAQDRDGTLWIGSESGLVNFDGQTFRLFQSPPGEPALPSGQVYSLLITKAGTLWVGFYQAGVGSDFGGSRDRVQQGRDGAARVGGSSCERRLTAASGPSPTSGISFGSVPMARGAANPRRHRPASAASSSIPRTRCGSLKTGFFTGVHSLKPRTREPRCPPMWSTGFAETPSGDIWMNDYDATTSLGRTQQVGPTGNRIRMLPQSPVHERRRRLRGGRIAHHRLRRPPACAGSRPEETSLRTDHRSNAGA